MCVLVWSIACVDYRLSGLLPVWTIACVDLSEKRSVVQYVKMQFVYDMFAHTTKHTMQCC